MSVCGRRAIGDNYMAHFHRNRTGILPIGQFLKLNKHLHIIHILKEEIELSRNIMLANVSDIWLLFNSSFDYQSPALENQSTQKLVFEFRPLS